MRNSVRRSAEVKLIQMAERRKRSQNFTIEEKDKLIQILTPYRNTILNKKTDGTTNEAKNKVWAEVTSTFNVSSNIYRTKDSLLKVWEKMKTESKVYYQSLNNVSMSDGEPSDVKFDPILDQVCAMLGRGCTSNMSILEAQECDGDSEDPPPVPECILTTEDSNDYLELTENGPENKIVCKSPIWSQRQSQLPHTNGNVSPHCSCSTNVNKKKNDIESLRKQLLEDEIEFKRKLHEFQLQAASKEVEIKTEILNQIKSGAINVQSLYGGPQNNSSTSLIS